MPTPGEMAWGCWIQAARDVGSPATLPANSARALSAFNGAPTWPFAPGTPWIWWHVPQPSRRRVSLPMAGRPPVA